MADSSLPDELAIDKPLQLGSTMLEAAGEDGYYMLKLDFEPESMQQAQSADLLLLGEGKVGMIGRLSL